MTSAAIHAYGTLLKMDDGLGSYTTVAELRGIPWPQIQNPRLDVTTHDGPGFGRQYVNNLADYPAVGFQVNYLPWHPTHDHLTGMIYVQAQNLKRNFKIFMPPAVSPALVLTFEAQVSQFNVTAPVDNVLTADVQLQPTGTPTFGST